jgi:maleate cis-trans isomerase
MIMPAPLRIGQIVPSSTITMKVVRRPNPLVVSAAVCTTFRMLQNLNLEPVVPNASKLLASNLAAAVE